MRWLLAIVTFALVLTGANMPVNRTLWDDPFSGYASQAEFEAAYFPRVSNTSVTSVNSADWGLTSGPGGVPGVRDTEAPPPRIDTGTFHKLFSTPCRAFKVSGRWDHAAINAILTTHTFLRLLYAEPSNDFSGLFGTIVSLQTQHAVGNLIITFQTADGHGNFASDRYQVVVDGVFPMNTISDIEIEGHTSTIRETTPGVFEPDDDGDVVVRVGGTPVAWWNGPLWHGVETTASWSMVEIHTIGRFTNLHVSDQSDCPDAPPDPEGDITICPPCVSPDPKTLTSGGGQANGADPWIQPLIGQQLLCAGGGLVPTQPDLVHSEQWWGR